MDLKPGPELDTLIAEKVMGGRAKMLAASEGSQAEYERARREVSYCRGYSTDIVAAWEVVQRLIELGKPIDLQFELSTSSEYPEEWQVSVQWDGEESSNGPFYLLGSTAPHAICLAALKVVGDLYVA